MTFFYHLGSLIILLVLILIWKFTKRINLYSESIFNKQLIILSFGVIVSILYTVLYMLFRDIISENIFSLIITVYLICVLVFIYYKAIHFFLIFLTVSQCKKISFPFAGYTLLQILIIIITPDKYYYSDLGVGLDNSGSILMTIFFIAHILIVSICIIINHKKINWYFRKFYFIDNVALLLGIAFEFFLKENGSLNLILAFDCAYTLCFIENPKGNIDDKLGCFKQNVLLPYLEEKYENRDRCFVVVVSFNYFAINKTVDSDVDKLKIEIVDEFMSVPKTNVFVNADGSIYAICDDTIYEDFIEDTKEMVDDRIINYHNLAGVKVGITSCANILMVENELILINLLSSSLKNIYSKNKQINYKEITKDTIDSIYKEEEINNKIVWALDNDKLEVFYQPIFSTKDNGFTTAEAFARIRNEDGTIMLPNTFIPIAKKSGLIAQIGDRVFQKVCEFISTPSFKEYNLKYVSINLSDSQCEDLELANKYSIIAKKYGIDPESMEFEIDQLDIAKAKNGIMNNMTIFAKNGFRVALDGYGNKESSFNSLLDYPVTSLKLDMHIIWNYSESYIQKEVCQAIIKIAHKLGIEIVAKGVETFNQLDEMIKQGVDYIQGYYFFAPMDIDDFKQFLRPTAFEINENNVTVINKINNSIKVKMNQNKQK